MIYLSVQPDVPYFHWQVEVFVHNFKKIGINPNKIEVVYLYSGDGPTEAGRKLQAELNTVRFFFYKDDRPDKSYIPSTKPYGFFKHLQQYPELNKQAIFYHDSDIIFLEKINESIFEGDDVWYLSDTIGYIGHDYILSKGLTQLLDMVDLVRVGREKVKQNQRHSGGAQYIVKGTTAAFWYKVYEDSHRLYHLMETNEKDEKSKLTGEALEKYHPIQKWCAEMWATLWNAWLFNFSTEVHPDLAFHFATTCIDGAKVTKIIHNAGVVESQADEMFYKGHYIDKLPYDVTKEYKQNFFSWLYFQAILEAGKNSLLK